MGIEGVGRGYLEIISFKPGKVNGQAGIFQQGVYACSYEWLVSRITIALILSCRDLVPYLFLVYT
jgi:hypothetical protein